MKTSMSYAGKNFYNFVSKLQSSWEYKISKINQNFIKITSSDADLTFHPGIKKFVRFFRWYVRIYTSSLVCGIDGYQ